MHKKQHQLVSRKMLVDKISLCCASLRACTLPHGQGQPHDGCCTLWEEDAWQRWKLIIVSVRQLKLMWSWSGLKASLEAQILSAFQWIPAEIPLETSYRVLEWWCGLKDDVARGILKDEPSLGATMMHVSNVIGCHWWKCQVNDVSRFVW